MKMLKVRWTFLEGLLGTSTANPDIYREYLAGRAPAPELAKEEAEVLEYGLSVDDEFRKAMTIHPKMADGTPFQYDYMVKGFMKDACGMLIRSAGKDESGKRKKGGNESSKIKAFKKEIDGNIFVFPRMIPIRFEGELGVIQRPLRAATAQGERIGLAASEEAPAGSTMEFWVLCLNEGHIPAVLEWMDYGVLRGTGQWRNSGKGRFLYEIIDEAEPETFAEAAKIGNR